MNYELCIRGAHGGGTSSFLYTMLKVSRYHIYVNIESDSTLQDLSNKKKFGGGDPPTPPPKTETPFALYFYF